MGQKDLYQSDFYEDNGRFADVFNGALFQGRAVMKAEELEEGDSQLISLLEAVGSETRGVKVIRDKVKYWKGSLFAIAVLESQTHVDYSMVLRAMKAEALGYEKQRRRSFEEARRKGIKLSPTEYVSGMRKEARFMPIITLVLYLGTEGRWDGAESLYELLDMDEVMKPFVSNYRLNLYDYHGQKDFSIFKTENRALFELLSCAGDKEKMKEMMKTYPEQYDHLDEDSVRAMLGIAGIRVNLEEIRRKREDGKEVYNVCKAFDDYKEEGRLEGIQEGMQKGITVSLRNLMDSLGMELEQAMDILKIKPEDRAVYRKHLV